MNHLEEFKKRADVNAPLLDLFLFGWVDASGNSGDYGLNVGPAEKTFQTLITTTYMFQPEPAFKLLCRPCQMTQAQFEYMQDHDLDTEAFMSKLGDLPDVRYELDLMLYKDAQSALNAMQSILVD